MPGKEAGAGQWSWRRELNPRPSDYKSDALPTELRQLICFILTPISQTSPITSPIKIS